MLNQNKKNSFIFLGDISLNGNYISYHKEGINPFKNLEEYLQKADFIIGNLESIAKGNYGENAFKKPRLTTTIETLNYLKNINLNVACLAQNHIYDNLEDGFDKTINFLKKNGIHYLGAGYNIDEQTKPIVIKRNDISIGLLNYVTQDTNPSLPPNAKIYPNIFDEEKTLKDILGLKSNTDFIVLSLHWGGRVEGGFYPDHTQPKLARKLIDAGADLIIGHHSHSIQPYEIYKGKYIFYSLGNFCFSDILFENKIYPIKERGKITSILSIDFFKSYYKININFFRNNGTNFQRLNYYPIKKRNWLFQNIFKIKIFWNLYFFYLKYILPRIFLLKRKDLNFNEKLILIKNSFLRQIRKAH